jgi:putative transposase
MSASNPPLPPFHLFDPEAGVSVLERRLPHWTQAGAVCFITWRTADSMPKAVLDEWHGQRGRWLRALGIDPDDPAWRDRLRELGPKAIHEFANEFWNRWHDQLDSGHGDCVLRRPELAGIVAESLRHFDGERYLLLDFVVMPNHVHLLAAFPDEEAQLAQCESWKRFTATRINQLLQQRGRFWQSDAFDHLVRNERQFDYLRAYIARNPEKAGLRPGEFVHYSLPLARLEASTSRHA